VLLCCQDFEGDAQGGDYVEEGGDTPLLFAARAGDVKSDALTGTQINEVGARAGAAAGDRGARWSGQCRKLIQDVQPGSLLGPTKSA